jgi:adenylate kinase family enzyme
VHYQRELLGQPPLDIFLNRMFLGNPGTGKTTCSKLYGQILKHLGFFSNGAVVSKTASDFVGAVVGESQQNTSQIVEYAKGKVLIINEAYVLDDNLYGKQVLDTLAEKVQGGPSDDIVVLLLGYEEQMLQMI